MEGLTYVDPNGGWVYDIVSQYANGYAILYHHDSAWQWIILCPDERLIRFRTESDLWDYALKNKLFRRKRGKK